MFYGFYHIYGINTTDTLGNPMGTLHTFATRKERDEWVDADTWDGNYHRTAMGSKDARKELESMYMELGIYSKGEARATDMSELVRLYAVALAR